jgi:hypothetical protein
MRFLLDPRLHLAFIAAMLLFVAYRFKAETEWLYVDSPSPTLAGRTDYRP